MENKNPKVFISHASEDKERFVLDFGEKLRSKGVDAWIDKWEMHPGDSLIEKIFEDGIGQSDVVIVVLSEYSINKNWVKEELNSATLRRIDENIRLIPVIINDFVTVPTSLNHLFRVRINDLNNYEDKFNEILMAIYNMDKKPPLGEKPAYVDYNAVPELNRIDAIVLKVLGDITIKNGNKGTFINNSELFENLKTIDISKEDAIDSIEILESRYLLNISRTLGGIESSPIKMTVNGFLFYCENFVLDFTEIYKDIISAVMNDKLHTNSQIATHTGYPNIIIDSILKHHGDLNHIKYPKVMSGLISIYEITPMGKRQFREILESK